MAQKSYGHGVFFVSTPFLLVMAAAAAADVPKSCFKSAENRAASSLEVAAN